ncbi:hypothetical protein E3P89_01872 [Wallemia ichthyophaga]|uniref:Uncharacterized protein n=1 Tax=Wallemia ichthyophaga TaxID=245174 RepID=A0A4T0IBH0_WALIC|nr:hypothetical protein E3P90_00871 [Wallemia ichthyophaga]TIB17276.1 hypothetical protein E3P93_00728 [Wallemia ichthyophaga]TIB22827.1 hypothetical protein E3P89_01872 [Wallemia ichthyophaga]TIB26729.1 hypothetical protein E3P88_00766 [Wallemia ichthyophaga]
MSLLLLHQPHLSIDLLELNIIKNIWHVENKYYSANVQASIHSTLALSEVHWDDIAAVVIIFDTSLPIDDLDESLECINNYSDSIQVKLAVGFGESNQSKNSVSNQSLLSDLDSDLDSHFIARQVEFIDPNSSDQGGLSRVHDSLSTVMWDGMQMTDNSGENSGDTSVKDTSKNTMKPSKVIAQSDNPFDDDFDDILSDPSDPLNTSQDDLSHLLSKLNTISAKVRSIDNIHERHSLAEFFADDLASYLKSDQEDEIN